MYFNHNNPINQCLIHFFVISKRTKKDIKHPHARPAKQPKSKRKRGGQQGHKKHERTLIPVEQCDEVHPLKPAECRRCGGKLSGIDPEPLRHQVWELPEIKPRVTEWARYRDGTLTRTGMKRLMKPIRAEIEALLLRGVFSGNERLTGMCNELYDHRQWLWTFLDHEDVEPTNNGSERALRHAVIWRKLSFGTQKHY